MKTTKRLAIYLDHSSAKLIEFDREVNETKTVFYNYSNNDRNESLGRSEKEIENRKLNSEKIYFKELSGYILQFDEVVLFGPTEAKTELFNILRKNNKFDEIKIEVLPTKKLTTNQQHAFVREYFKVLY